LVLSHKLRNHRVDFNAQITKPKLFVLRLKPGETITTGFEAKSKETITVVLRSNQ
jgi:hypothetical protein